MIQSLHGVCQEKWKPVLLHCPSGSCAGRWPPKRQPKTRNSRDCLTLCFEVWGVHLHAKLSQLVAELHIKVSNLVFSPFASSNREHGRNSGEDRAFHFLLESLIFSTRSTVIPAKAGIHEEASGLQAKSRFAERWFVDGGLRRHDGRA